MWFQFKLETDGPPCDFNLSLKRTSPHVRVDGSLSENGVSSSYEDAGIPSKCPLPLEAPALLTTLLVCYATCVSLPVFPNYLTLIHEWGGLLDPGSRISNFLFRWCEPNFWDFCTFQLA